MKKYHDTQKNMLILPLAFLLPAFIMLLIFIAGDFAPFGKVSILLADMQYQFVDYIGYLKSVFFGNNDMFYTFSKTFGGDMSGMSAYYLFNPFFLILLLFPNDILPIGIVWMIIITVGVAGFLFNLMLSGIWGERISSLLFSTSYALMGYFTAYINCIQYFAAVMLLPVVILGLFKTIRNRKINLLYVLSVAAAVITNYYIGYMILIFTAVFFLFVLFSGIEKFDDIKDRIKTSVVVLYSTVLGIGISAFSLCAVVHSLQGQKDSGINLSLALNFNVLDFFSGLYTSAFKGNISDGLPIIYSGSVVTVFMLLYFASKSINLKEKLLAAGLFLFMLLGFLIDGLNVAWHGFAHPIGFPYRNSFLFSFLVIFFGYRGFNSMKEGFRKSQANVIIVIFVLYSIYLYVSRNAYADTTSIIITFVIVCLTLIFIVSIREKDKYVAPAIMGLIVLQLADLYSNGKNSVNAYFENKEDESVSIETFTNYIDDVDEMLNLIKENDDDFYRIEKTFRRTHNDPMMFAYNGLSHFSSTETVTAKSFLGRLGFRVNGLWAYYGQGNTTFADCLMGVKYLLSQYDEIPKPYDYLYADNDTYLYRNNYALPMAFGMNNAVKKISMVDDPFMQQNKMASCFTGTHFQLYKPVIVKDINLHNVVKDGNIYKRTSDDEAYVEFMLNISSDDFIYMYFTAPEVQDAALTVNGMYKDDYFTIYDWSVRECGHYVPGETIPVRFTLRGEQLEIDDYYFYYEKKEIIKHWYKEATNTKCNVDKITSSHLLCKANVASSSDMIVFTVPYEEDWKVTVDGENVKPIKIMDALMAVNVDEGEHEIELRYIPKGYVVGTPISIVAFLTTMIVVFVSRNKKKR